MIDGPILFELRSPVLLKQSLTSLACLTLSIQRSPISLG